MAKVSPFHSICDKDNQRVYHNNSSCTEGNNIEARCRQSGDGGRQLCDHCRRLA